MNVEESVQALVSYGIDKNLIQKEDAVYTANTVFDVLGVEPSYEFSPLGGEPCPLEDILKVLLNDAQTRGYIEEGIASRDLFDTKIMGCLTPRPSEVIRRFRSDYSESPMKATDNFYALSLASDYIRSYRVKKDRKWKSDTKYGKMDITINLSKPEKDPKAIAAALKKKQDAYPRCFSVGKMKAMRGVWIIRPVRQSASYRSPSGEKSGICSIRLMFIIMSIASFSPGSTCR